MKAIDIDKWDLERQERVSAFKFYWSYQRAKEGSDLPNFLTQKEWDEQFKLFVETVYNPSVKLHGFFKSTDAAK